MEKDPAKKEAALKFLKFFYSKSLYEDLYKEGIIVPAKMDGAQTSNAYLQEIVALTSGKGTGKIFDQTLSKQVSEVLQNGLQSITIKQKTAEQVAKEMQAEQDKLNK